MLGIESIAIVLILVSLSITLVASRGWATEEHRTATVEILGLDDRSKNLEK